MTQNNTLSAVEISNLINEKNNKIKEYVANNPNHHPHIYDRILEVGVENIFFITESYRSHYHDDYCTFIYWDNVLGKKIEDNWTTAAYCPNYDMYKDSIFTVDEAKQYNLYNKKAVLNFACDGCRSFIILSCSSYERQTIFRKYNKLVKVEDGRKWKGEGYLISVEEKKFGYSKTYDAKILSISDNNIYHCNGEYVKSTTNVDEVVEEYIKWANAKLDEVIANNDFDAFFEIDGYAWSVKPEHRFWFENYVEDNYSTPDITALIANAYDVAVEEKKKLEFDKIVEWVKNKTDKKGDDIEKLAIHIFNKKYKNTLGTI